MDCISKGVWLGKDPLDTAQWCPYPEFKHLVSVGSYRYNEELKDRKGEIILLDISDPENITSFKRRKKCGILDNQWNPKYHQLATAQANGLIKIFTLPDLDDIAETNLDKEDIIALSVAWNVTGSSLAATDSKGGLSVCNLRETGLEVTRNWPDAHNFEAWITTWDSNCHGLLYSGGDDCRLNIWDVRTDSNKPIGFFKNLHESGVTAISSDSQEPHLLATGSYDEFVHILDLRNLGISNTLVSKSLRIQPLSSKNVCGGVWRIRWNTIDNEKFIAIASMRAGFQVLKYSNEGNLQKMCDISSKIHSEGLAYGIDWGPNNQLVTCSFQDKKLSLSELTTLN